eukprot:SAG11_NODE_2915_length_2841_cov_1.755653_1_plen_54_part_10
MIRKIIQLIQGWPRNKARLTFSNSDNFLRSNMCTLLWGKDTKEKTNNEEDVERV